MKLDVDYSPEPAVSERDHGHGRDQQQERDPGRDRDVHRSGHRREFDARHPRRSLSDRVEGVVRDVGTFRAVALADIVNCQFDGHPFAARQGIAQAEQRGWIVREQAQGPTGRPYTVLVATPAGAARAAVLFASTGRADQRVYSGAVKAADVGHEVAVYRAACAAQARLEAEGGRVARIRIDAELKGQVAARAERARQTTGRAAAEAARRCAAAELSLPVEHGTVLFSGRSDRVRHRGGLGRALSRRGRIGALRRWGHSREGRGRVPDVRGLRPRCGCGAAGAGRRGRAGWPQPARPQRRQSGVRGLRVMRPWRVAVGLTMTGGALAVWALWLELAYLRPYWQVLLADYGWYIGAQGSLGLMTFGVGVYVAARSVSLGAVGRKVDVVERAIRRGTGQDPELAEALARDASGDYSE